MLKRNFAATFCVLTAILSFSAAGAVKSQDLSFLSDSVSYAWPTNSSQYLSSTFAETRSAHLHSGLDIRTWGREGYDVYATRAGELYRVGTGPSGYGNVIYLRHADGSYSVYAHLQRFRPDIQAYVDSIRLQDYRFEIDHFVPGEQFTFEQGELIGFTGSTGVGPPHLHFELRTPDFEPFNPLLTNLSIDDTLPPVIRSIAIESLDAETLRFSDYDIRRPAGETDGTVDFGKITADGPIGVSVNVHDRANRTPNSYAVYELLMIADGDTLFHSRADNFDFNESSMMFLDRSYPILAQTRRGFQRLYNVNGNQLPIYRRLSNRGLLGLTPGVQAIEIIAVDYYGNKSNAQFTLEREGSRTLTSVESVPAYPVRTEPAGPVVTQTSIKEKRSAPFYRLFDNQTAIRGPATPDRQYAYFLNGDDTPPTKVSTLVPGRKNVLHSPEYRAWLEIPSKSLYDTLVVSMEYHSDANVPRIQFEPNRLPVNQPMELTMLLPDEYVNDPAAGLYSYDEFRDRHFFVSSDIEHGVLRATINEFAELRIRRDINAPWLGKAEFADHPSGIKVVHVPAVDRDSGIDYRRSVITVNGYRGIVEYDGDVDRLIFYHPNLTFEPGEHQVEVSVYDRTGNLSERSYRLTLP